MHQAIREKGWRQGVFFRLEDSRRLIADHGFGEESAQARLLLVSHDCDIMHRRDREPRVEVCVAELLETQGVRGLYGGKNSRLIHCPANSVDGTTCFFEISASNRFAISRELLADLEPDATYTLTDDTKLSLRLWLASRFAREALPDAFNDRIKPVERDVDRIFKRFLNSLLCVYIMLDPNDELEAGVDYRVRIYGCMKAEDCENPEIRDDVQAAISDIATAWNSCEGISVEDDRLVSESEVTVELIRKKLIQLDYDYLSFREEPAGSIAPRQS